MTMLPERRHKKMVDFGSAARNAAWVWSNPTSIVLSVIVGVGLLMFLLPMPPALEHENLPSFLVNMMAVLVCCKALSHWRPAKMLALCAASAAVSQTSGAMFVEKAALSSYPIVLGLLAATVSVQCCADLPTLRSGHDSIRKVTRLFYFSAPQVAVIFLAFANLLLGTNNGLSLWHVLPVLPVGAAFVLWPRLSQMPDLERLVHGTR